MNITITFKTHLNAVKNCWQVSKADLNSKDSKENYIHSRRKIISSKITIVKARTIIQTPQIMDLRKCLLLE